MSPARVTWIALFTLFVLSALGGCGFLPGEEEGSSDSGGGNGVSLGLKGGAFLDAGTSANQLVQLDGNGKLPALDGSPLFNVTVNALTPAAKGNFGLKSGPFAEVGSGAGQVPVLDGKGALPATALVPYNLL